MDLSENLENKKGLFEGENCIPEIPNIHRHRPYDPIPPLVYQRRNDNSAVQNIISSSTISLKNLINLFFIVFGVAAMSSIFFPYLRFIFEFSKWAFDWVGKIFP